MNVTQKNMEECVFVQSVSAPALLCKRGCAALNIFIGALVWDSWVSGWRRGVGEMTAAKWKPQNICKRSFCHQGDGPWLSWCSSSTIRLLYIISNVFRGGARKSILLVEILNLLSALSMGIIIGGMGGWVWPSRAQIGKLLKKCISRMSRFLGNIK